LEINRGGKVDKKAPVRNNRKGRNAGFSRVSNTGRRCKMADYMQDGEKSEELTKIGNIAADLQMDEKMRTQAINVLGDMASHESLLVLLNLVANDKAACSGKRTRAKEGERDS